jgi:hypothetical protein
MCINLASSETFSRCSKRSFEAGDSSAAAANASPRETASPLIVTMWRDVRADELEHPFDRFDDRRGRGRGELREGRGRARDSSASGGPHLLEGRRANRAEALPGLSSSRRGWPVLAADLCVRAPACGQDRGRARRRTRSSSGDGPAHRRLCLQVAWCRLHRCASSSQSCSYRPSPCRHPWRRLCTFTSTSGTITRTTITARRRMSTIIQQ